MNVSVLLEEFTICVGDGCANRFADEAGSEGCCPSCLAFWGRPRTEQRRSPQPRSPAVAPLRGLTTMPDVKCLGADPSAVVDGLATGTEVGPPRAPGRQRRTPTVLGQLGGGRGREGTHRDWPPPVYLDEDLLV